MLRHFALPRPVRGRRGSLLRARLAVTLVLAMAWAWSSGLPAVEAHAIILDSDPAHGASVPTPRRLVLRFNSRLEKPLCSVQLVGPHQRSIALLRQEADATPDTLVYAMPALEPGAYQARWKVMAADGHVTEGAVLFTVLGPAGR